MDKNYFLWWELVKIQMSFATPKKFTMVKVHGFLCTISNWIQKFKRQKLGQKIHNLSNYKGCGFNVKSMTKS